MTNLDFISTLKLKLRYDVAKLQADLTAVALAANDPGLTSSQETTWIPHANEMLYTGEWGGIALRNTTSKIADIAADPVRGHSFVNTRLMDASPYIAGFLSDFKCPIGSVRFLRLEAGAVIGEHVDAGLCYEYGEARLHIPVHTNPELEFFVNQQQIIMNEGECWYINANNPHSVANRGRTDRIHLVIDVGVNDWTQALFESALGQSAPPIMKVDF
ncbi:MAG: aspartyl/asparaginyl beta-hydroxylase domain-containing protein [Chloroflexota bacterium]